MAQKFRFELLDLTATSQNMPFEFWHCFSKKKLVCKFRITTPELLTLTKDYTISNNNKRT